LPHYVYVIFLSVKSGLDETVAGLEGGADDFLRKPVDRSELLARMRAGSRVLALERRLSRMAQTDPLTGLITRRGFYDALAKEWERAKRFRLPLSCVMMDIDFFKRINDVHGHQAGDTVLKAVARRLVEISRACDLVCRHGGEEFCVMLPETGEHGAEQWAQRARQAIAELAVPIGDMTLRITGSFGTAQRHEDTQTPEQLVDQADQALLCAKRSGRDRVVRFESLAESSELELADGEQQGSLFHGVLARHVMTPAVACLRDDDTVGQAAEFFLRSRINSTPVVDAQGNLSGILSEKDLMAALVSLEYWSRPIREVMKPNVICYEGDTPIRTIYEFLCRVSIRRVIVVEQGQPIGTIARSTLLRWFRNTVIANGLLESAPQVSRDLETDPHRSKERLAETAREMAQQIAELEDRLREDAEDLVPHVVGGATRMQELLDDLLAYSRYANTTGGAEAVLRSLLLNTSPSD
ncbi:MAG: diguanylate cyclase, partial [Thermoguttaceae bacterium]|jgi:diguanylate cyclase (GGDEF)-like protein|nr:diguanylate cyclase [Thermoguttaceae bacterium]